MPTAKLTALPASTAEEKSEVDRFCFLVGECAKAKPIFDEKDALRDRILARFPALAADKTATADGTLSDVLITARDQKRQVTIAGKRKLFQLWKAGEFFKRCELALKQLPDPKDPLNLYTTEERLGPRHVLPLPKPLPRAA